MTLRRVLALVEPGRRGDAAVSHARLIALSESAQLTVVALARQASGPRCGTSILDYNAAVAQAASDDIARVREALADIGAPVTYMVLRQRDDSGLARFVAAGAFAVVLLPSRRRRPGPLWHPEADRLAARTTAEIRVVGPEAGRVAEPPANVSSRSY